MIYELEDTVTTGVLGAPGSDAGIISRIVDGAPVPTLLYAKTRTLKTKPVVIGVSSLLIVNEV